MYNGAVVVIIADRASSAAAVEDVVIRGSLDDIDIIAVILIDILMGLITGKYAAVIEVAGVFVLFVNLAF